METNLLHVQFLTGKPSPSTTIFFAPRISQNNPRFLSICSARNSSNNNISNEDVPAPQLPVSASEAVEIRFRKRSRKRRQFKDGNVKSKAEDVKEPAKKWEEMSLSEKALELYMGEKGMLFWLNKFAYASIFIIIGGWILFRFVGPSLNLYQLDAPPLSPSSILKG